MTAPLPDGLINAITRWGNTTINISRQLGLPQSDEAIIIRDFLTALHPDRYSRQFHIPLLTHVDQLAEVLWRSILNAHIQPNRIPLPNYAPPTATAQSGSWRPTQSSVDPWDYAASPLAHKHHPPLLQLHATLTLHNSLILPHHYNRLLLYQNARLRRLSTLHGPATTIQCHGNLGK